MTDFSHGSGGRQEPGGDGHAAGTGPWNSEQGLQGGAPYNQFGQQQAPFGQQQAPFGQQQPLGYDGAFASNNMPGAPNSMPGAPNNVPGAPNAPSQASAPDAAGRQASGEYDYAPSVTPGSSRPFSQPPAGGPPFGDPHQANGMGYGGQEGAGYPPGGMYGGAFEQPRRRVSPLIVVVAVIAVIGVVVGALWATGVFGKDKPEANPTSGVTDTTDPDDSTPTDDDSTPTDDDTTSTDDDTTTDPTGPSSRDTDDPLGQIGYQIKPVTKQGDAYALQDTSIQVLEYKADAREQAKAANSQDYRDDRNYIGVKLRLTYNGSKRAYPFEYRFYVGDQSSKDLMFNIEDKSQDSLMSIKPLEAGKPIEGWLYFSTTETPNAGQLKLYLRTPADRYPQRNAYRCEEPIG